jgi:hypothetical protein
MKYEISPDDLVDFENHSKEVGNKLLELKELLNHIPMAHFRLSLCMMASNIIALESLYYELNEEETREWAVNHSKSLIDHVMRVYRREKSNISADDEENT